MERIWRPDGTVDTTRYFDGELIVTSTARSGSVTQTKQYLFKDHLGSTDLITDRTGAVEQAMSFDAFGLRRLADEFGSLTDAERAGFDTSATTLGFGNHEGLDAVGLVHMNGRVYDPLIGRFISADPYIPAPHLTQSYNLYSYAMNNPLSYVDPDGFFFKKLLRVAGTVASIVWAFHGNWIPLIINSLVNAAIKLVPELSRVSQAFNYATVASSSLQGRSAATPSKMCIAANRLTGPTEVEATAGDTVSEQHTRAANGAYSRAYIITLRGGTQAENKSPDSRIKEHWAITLLHPLYNHQLPYENLEANCEKLQGPSRCEGREAQDVLAVGDDLATMVGVIGFGSVVQRVGQFFGTTPGRLSRAFRSGHFPTSSRRVWRIQGHKSAERFRRQMQQRGWTDSQIDEAIAYGERFSAPNRVNSANSATGYVHPKTRRSVVMDDVTKEVLHVGGDGFRY